MTKHDNKTADELILEDAPDSATHYCCGTYCKANKDFFYDWDGEYWCAYFVPDGDMRSLADIEAIVEKDKKIAELEKYNLDLSNESCAKSERIAELEEKIRVAMKFVREYEADIKEHKEND